MWVPVQCAVCSVDATSMCAGLVGMWTAGPAQAVSLGPCRLTVSANKIDGHASKAGAVDTGRPQHAHHRGDSTCFA